MEQEIKNGTYTIPEGFAAKIEDGKIIVEKKESDDENIRKEIIEYLTVTRKKDLVGHPERQRWIAYLKKQKEPIPIPDKFSGLKSLMLQYLQSAANRKDDTEIESDTDLWGRKILDYVWRYDGLQKEQKPAEWSAEDEKMLKDVYESLYAYQCDIRAGMMDKNALELLKDVDKEKAWLKSLRPQPKPTCPHYSEGYGCDISPTKSCATCDKNPSPHWKPSEEQMEAIQYVSNFDYGGHRKALESLYNDLKKL